MASRNNKLFMTSFEANDYNSDSDRLGQIKPEYTARALLREARENAQYMGIPVYKALIHKVGLEPWTIELAKRMSYSNLEIWLQYLQQGKLPYNKGVTLGQVQLLIDIKRDVTEEVLPQIPVDETKQLQYRSTVETAIVRKAHRPQKTKNPNFTPEKESHLSPDYDGGEINKEDFQTPGMWVFPTEICLWPSKQRVLLISDLTKNYKQKMRKGDASGIPAHLLKYEVADWILRWKGSLKETYTRPDAKRRFQIEQYKQREIDKLRVAARQADHGNYKQFNFMAREYLGYRYANVDIEDLPKEKRIENQIRRKFNNKKNRIEGITYLPPVAAGEMLHPLLTKRVQLLISKNPKLQTGEPWVIKCYFDADKRENQDGSCVVTAGVQQLIQRHERHESGKKNKKTNKK